MIVIESDCLAKASEPNNDITTITCYSLRLDPGYRCSSVLWLRGLTLAGYGILPIPFVCYIPRD
jgi:hypothetical protein